MKEVLYRIVGLIARLHEKFLTLNNKYEYYFTDKQLHFYVIGLLGMGLLCVVHPLFKYLAKKNHVMVISWIYVFTLLVVITFAIEIGQGYTKTGVMEFADIEFGLIGFFLMFGIFGVIRMIVKTVKSQLHQKNTETE